MRKGDCITERITTIKRSPVTILDAQDAHHQQLAELTSPFPTVTSHHRTWALGFTNYEVVSYRTPRYE
ncbi:hypothetical protein J7297_02977 [Nakaseomyces glabratus]|nr:hypothetical protein J7297_02977 [Nakaseomyces glabratus]